MIRLIYSIEKLFDEAETPKYKIKFAENPSLIPMIGAARNAPQKCSSLLVFDFGQTLTKRGLAKFEKEELKEIISFSSLKSKHVEERESVFVKKVVAFS